MLYWFVFFFFKQKTAYDMRISDWSSDVCSSDLSSSYWRKVRVCFEGNRMVIDTLPASHAGGMTNCARWPVGNVSETTGSVSAMRCPVLLSFTTAVQNWRARSKVRLGTSTRFHPSRRSRYTPPGRLTEISVTSGDDMYQRITSTWYW